MKPLQIEEGSSIRSQITGYYRNAIRSGELPEGSVLPPARRLAGELGTAEANVHHALTELVREGLVARRPKMGTVVISPRRMHRVAFYLSELYTLRGERFTLPLVATLERALERRGIECQVIYESGAGDGRKLLERLAASRKVQGVIARGLTAAEIDRFSRLPVPCAGFTELRHGSGVTFLAPPLADAMAEAARRSGCRKLGVLYPGAAERHKPFFDRLRARAAEAGIHLEERWIFDRTGRGGSDVIDVDRFAWDGIRHLTSGPERPDGVLLFSDDLVSGATMAFYAGGIAVPGALRVVVHRTVENPVVFPFDCMLVEQRLSEAVELLVGKLTDLFEGRQPREGELSIAIREHRLPNPLPAD